MVGAGRAAASAALASATAFSTAASKSSRSNRDSVRKQNQVEAAVNLVLDHHMPLFALLHLGPEAGHLEDAEQADFFENVAGVLVGDAEHELGEVYRARLPLPCGAPYHHHAHPFALGLGWHLHFPARLVAGERRHRLPTLHFGAGAQ